jgi:translation initiation factor IF-2
MSEGNIRINKVLRELNISLERAVDYLKDKGIAIEASSNTKISDDVYTILCGQFAGDKGNKEASKGISEEIRKEKEALRLEREKEIEDKRKQEEERLQQQELIKAKATVAAPKQVGKIDLEPKKVIAPALTVSKPVIEKPESSPKKEIIAPKETKAEAPQTPEEAVIDETHTTQYQNLTGPILTGQKIDLTQFNKPKKKKEEFKKEVAKPVSPATAQNASANNNANKNKRKRIPPKPGEAGKTVIGGGGGSNAFGPNKSGIKPGGGGFQKGARPAIVQKVEPTEEEVKNQIKETLERLQGKGNKSKAAKYRRDKRDTHRQRTEEEMQALEEGSKTIKVTEFVTVGEIATMMDVPITKVIGTCMTLGIMVTMNQRLDAETLSIVADEFGYEVEFITSDIEDAIEVVKDKPEDLVSRAPIVTVMGHVDHGKTSLLDYIRKENVIAGESGGITQHIGAYAVTLDGGQKITFLDTPGHEAFTAMRARGAQVTDIAIIVVAADDDIMPQTKEAISHAQAANVPMIFAINKIDKQGANPEKIKEKLAAMNLLVEDWGGKYQSHDISAKKGTGVKELLEKILLEAEILDLKANPNKPAIGTVV